MIEIRSALAAAMDAHEERKDEGGSGEESRMSRGCNGGGGSEI